MQIPVELKPSLMWKKLAQTMRLIGLFKIWKPWKLLQTQMKKMSLNQWLVDLAPRTHPSDLQH